jgi:hypothetical protein
LINHTVPGDITPVATAALQQKIMPILTALVTDPMANWAFDKAVGLKA